MEPTRVQSLVESLLFVAEKPVTIPQLKNALGDEELGNEEIREAINRIREFYRSEERGIELAEIAMGFQFRTVPEIPTEA